jgi:hypothetical protein
VQKYIQKVLQLSPIVFALLGYVGLMIMMLVQKMVVEDVVEPSRTFNLIVVPPILVLVVASPIIAVGLAIKGFVQRSKMAEGVAGIIMSIPLFIMVAVSFMGR